MYSAGTSDSDNFAAEISCRKENTEYRLSKCLLALAGYCAPGRVGYKALSCSRLHRAADRKIHVAALGHVVFKALCDSTKWHKSELPVTNCMSLWPFLQSQLSSSSNSLRQWLHLKEGKDVIMQEMVKKALMPEENVEMHPFRK